MIKPYTAVGLIPVVRGIRKREDIQINVEHLARSHCHGGMRALPPRGVRHPKNGRLKHLWMSSQHRFDFGRIDVLATRNDAKSS